MTNVLVAPWGRVARDGKSLGGIPNRAGLVWCPEAGTPLAVLNRQNGCACVRNKISMIFCCARGGLGVWKGAARTPFQASRDDAAHTNVCHGLLRLGKLAGYDADHREHRSMCRDCQARTSGGMQREGVNRRIFWICGITPSLAKLGPGSKNDSERRILYCGAQLAHSARERGSSENIL